VLLDFHFAGLLVTALVTAWCSQKIMRQAKCRVLNRKISASMRDEKEKAIDFLNQQALADARQKETTT